MGLQGEPEFERLKRELEEVKNAPRGLEGTFRSAAEMERHRAQMADAAIEEQLEVQTAFRWASFASWHITCICNEMQACNFCACSTVTLNVPVRGSSRVASDVDSVCPHNYSVQESTQSTGSASVCPEEPCTSILIVA